MMLKNLWIKMEKVKMRTIIKTWRIINLNQTKISQIWVKQVSKMIKKLTIKTVNKLSKMR